MAKVHPTRKRPNPEKVNHPSDGQSQSVPGRTLREMIANGFVLPTVELNPRKDGRTWSEVEPWEDLSADVTPTTHGA